MTSPVATIGLRYDGTDLQVADLSIFLEITSGLDDSPEVRGVDVVVPYVAGRTPRPRRFDRRVLVLTGHVMGVGTDESDSRSDYRTNRRTLATLFDVERDPADLRVELEDGDIARISCRPTSLIANEIIAGNFATISVELEAVSDWEGLGS